MLAPLYIFQVPCPNLAFLVHMAKHAFKPGPAFAHVFPFPLQVPTSIFVVLLVVLDVITVEILVMSMMLHLFPEAFPFRAQFTTEDVQAVVLFLDDVHVGRVPPDKARERLIPVALDGFTPKHLRPATDGANVCVFTQVFPVVPIKGIKDVGNHARLRMIKGVVRVTANAVLELGRATVAAAPTTATGTGS